VTLRRADAGWISAVSYVVRAATAAAGLVAVAGLLAGCAGNKPAPAAGPAAASSGGFQAYVDCLQQHGVTINVPTARPTGVRPSGVRPSGVRPSGVRPSGVRPSGRGGGGFGGGGFPGSGNTPPSGVDQATWDAARQACASVRPSFGPRAGAGGNNSAIAAYRNCLRDHGVTASSGPGQLNTADPKVAAAMQACAPLLPTARPSPTG
jgi:hypothetical protein